MLAAKRRERDAQPLGRQRDELRDLDPLAPRALPSGAGAADMYRATAEERFRFPLALRSLMYALATRITLKYIFTFPGPLFSSSSFPAKDKPSCR